MTDFVRSLFISAWFLVSSIGALQHNFVVTQDSRTLIAPIGTPYGFLEGGCFGFEVFDFNIESDHPHSRKKNPSKSEVEREAYLEGVLNSVDAGFLLKRFKSESAFTKYEEEFLTDPKHCIFDAFVARDEDPVFQDDDFSFSTQEDPEVVSAATDGIYLPVRWANSTWNKNTAMMTYKFKEGESGLYFLLYQVCSRTGAKVKIRSTFAIDFHYRNKDFLGSDSYLTAGEMPLPLIFFYFSISYLGCWLIWVMNIRSINKGNGAIFGGSTFGHRVMVYPIHHIMSLLLLLKTTTTFFESVRYHYLRVTGHAEFWSVIYYTFSFLKGMFLFTTILLIGSGWSFVKPFLTDREKKIIFLVLFLQVLDNIALVVLSQETEGETKYDDWSAALHLIDILCCCAVLVPIVWHVSALESKLESVTNEDNNIEDGRDVVEAPPVELSEDDARTLSKLKLFRSFYVMVVAYIYTTRIAVYIFATMLDYRHTYVRYLVTELATLVFYVLTGLRFRPMPENPYMAVVNKKEDVEDDVHFDSVPKSPYIAALKEEEVELEIEFEAEDDDEVELTGMGALSNNSSARLQFNRAQANPYSDTAIKRKDVQPVIADEGDVAPTMSYLPSKAMAGLQLRPGLANTSMGVSNKNDEDVAHESKLEEKNHEKAGLINKARVRMSVAEMAAIYASFDKNN